MAELNDAERRPGDPNAVVEVAGLWKIFGDNADDARRLADQGLSRFEIQEQTGAVVAVRDVGFQVAAGETFVVMGLSGSGKSTLIRCLARLIEPTRGTISLCGTDVVSLSPDALRDLRRHRLAMVFQHFGLFPHRTVIDNIAFGLEIRGVPKAERRETARDLLDTVGLGGWGDHYPQQLSGGMQQRVGLARALAVNPDILFFDEPFSALDPLIRRDMQDELIELQRRMQRTLVFITHDFNEALRLADRIAIMRDGELVQVGTAVEIVTAPANDYVAAFTKDAPKAKMLTVEHAMVRVGSADVTVSAAGSAAVTSVGSATVTSVGSATVTSVGSADVMPSMTVTRDTVLEDCLPTLLANPEPVGVVDDDGDLIGLVSQANVARLLQPGADDLVAAAPASSSGAGR